MKNKSSPRNFLKSLNCRFPMSTTQLEVISSRFEYIEHLNTKEPDNNFYSCLLFQHKENKFSLLKGFSPEYDEISLNSYVECVEEYGRTFTKLRFVGHHLIDNKPYSSYISRKIYFKSFLYLTELLIDDGGMHFTRPEPMPIYWFDSIVDDCTFKKLGFYE